MHPSEQHPYSRHCIGSESRIAEAAVNTPIQQVVASREDAEPGAGLVLRIDLEVHRRRYRRIEVLQGSESSLPQHFHTDADGESIAVTIAGPPGHRKFGNSHSYPAAPTAPEVAGIVVAVVPYPGLQPESHRKFQSDTRTGIEQVHGSESRNECLPGLQEIGKFSYQVTGIYVVSHHVSGVAPETAAQLGTLGSGDVRLMDIGIQSGEFQIIPRSYLSVEARIRDEGIGQFIRYPDLREHEK